MKVVGFIICFVIFLASLYLFSLAFQFEGDVLPFLTFLGGIIGVCIAFAIPIHLLKRTAP